MQFKNVSPLGALDVPLVNRVVEPGEVIDVTHDQAVFIAAQFEAWEAVDSDAIALAAELTAPAEAIEPAEPANVTPPANTKSKGDDA